MKRKLISSLLCLCMLVSLIPVAAFASEETQADGAKAGAAIGDLQFYADGDKANAVVNKKDSERDTMIIPYSGLETEKTYALTLVYPKDVSHKMSKDAITPSKDENAAQEELINEWKPTKAAGMYYITLNAWTGSKNPEYAGLGAGTYTVKLYEVTTSTETKEGESATTAAKTYTQLQTKEITLTEVTIDFGSGKTADSLITQHEDKGAEKFFTAVQNDSSKVKIFVNQADIANVTNAGTTLQKLITPKGVAENMVWTYANNTFTGTLPTPAVTITTAPLHDTSDRVADSALCSGYSVSQPNKDNKITVSASNVRLHKNADTEPAYGYWTGVQFKAPAGYTVKYKALDGATSTEWAKDVESGAYVSLYSDFELKPNRTITIGLFDGESATPVTGTEKTYTIDFSGVKAKTPTATLGYTALPDKTVVSDCAPETIYVKFDEPLRPGYLWFDITDPSGVVYGIAGSSQEIGTDTKKLPTTQAWSFQNKGQFEAWPGKGTDNEAAPGVKDGTYRVVGYYVTGVDKAPTTKPSTGLREIFNDTVAVTAPAKDVTVVEPAKADVGTSSLVGADNKPVDTATAKAISNALENVKPTNTSAGVLQNAADTSAKTTSSNYDKADAVSKLNTAIGGTSATTDNISIVYQPYLKVEAKTYDATNKSLTVNITPKCKVVATTKGSESNLTGSNSVKIGEEDLTVSKPIEMTIGLPADFVSKSGTYPPVYIQHKGYEYPATVSEVFAKDGTTVASLLATFINPHGFSDFTVTADPQTVAIVGDNSYTTLQAAVEAAVAGPDNTIVLKKKLTGDAAKATVTLSANKTLNFKNFSGTDESVLTINNKTVTVNSTAPVSETFPKNTTEGGGGGGVSSNVTIDRPTNGKVSVTPTAPSKGATVTINLTPDTGYAVGTVTVTDKDGKAVELTKVSDTKYTFTMPDGKVKVAATFTKVDTPPATGFTDVAADAYYADAVKWAVDKGITNGLTATTFGPNNSCTRAQMVTFLWRGAGSPAPTGTNSFTDVASGEYYYNAVLWAVEKGITKGTTDTTFSPNATVNRAQTVTFLYRYAGSPAATGDNAFTDVAAGQYYTDAVKWAVAEEITNGTSATTFAPNNNCTRGQIVTFLYRQMAE